MGGLTLVEPEQNPVVGSSSEATRPITSGERAIVVAEQDVDSSFWGDLWGGLDKLGDTQIGSAVIDGISGAAEKAAGVRVQDMVGGSETARTNVGDPTVVAGGSNQGASAIANGPSFFEQYKTPLMLAGGAVALLVALRLVK